MTAITCANDVLAAAAVHASIERGWRVPEDISVAGWDNNSVGEWLFPPLTTVAIDYEQVGHRAMTRLPHTIK